MGTKIYNSIAKYLIGKILLISAPFLITPIIVKPVIDWNQLVLSELIALDSDKDGITNIYDVTPYITLLKASVAPAVCYGPYYECDSCGMDACSSPDCPGYDAVVCGGGDSCGVDACSSSDCPGYDAVVCGGGDPCAQDACSSSDCPGYDSNVCAGGYLEG